MSDIGSTMHANTLNTWDFENPLRPTNLDRCSEQEECKPKQLNCQRPSWHGAGTVLAQHNWPRVQPGLTAQQHRAGRHGGEPQLGAPAGHKALCGPQQGPGVPGHGVISLWGPIAGCCLGSEGTWPQMSAWREQEENEAETCLNLFSPWFYFMCSERSGEGKLSEWLIGGSFAAFRRAIWVTFNLFVFIQ